MRYREGYYAPNSDAWPDRERQLLEALREDTPRVDFPIALETGEFRLNANDIFVPITAKLAPTAQQWAASRIATRPRSISPPRSGSRIPTALWPLCATPYL